MLSNCEKQCQIIRLWSWAIYKNYLKYIGSLASANYYCRDVLILLFIILCILNTNFISVEGNNHPTYSFVLCFYLLWCVPNSIFRKFDQLRSKVLKDVVDKFSANSSRKGSQEERREQSSSNQRLESHAIIIITSFVQ